MTDVTDRGASIEEPPRPALPVALVFHDEAKASGIRLPVGLLVVEASGRAYVIDTTGRESPEARQAVLALCEQMRAETEITGKPEAERVLVSLAHALAYRLARDADGAPPEPAAAAPAAEESVH